MKVTRLRRCKWLSAAVPLWLIAAASPALCADVAGVIRNEADRPVIGAEVAAQNSSTAVVAMMVVSDRNGTYCLSDLPRGTYDIVLEMARNAPAQRQITGSGVYLRTQAPSDAWYTAGRVELYVDSTGSVVNWKLQPSGVAVATVAVGVPEKTQPGCRSR